MKWNISDSIIYYQPSTFDIKKRIAFFDFDHTIATVLGNHTFPKHSKDYKLFNSNFLLI